MNQKLILIENTMNLTLLNNIYLKTTCYSTWMNQKLILIANTMNLMLLNNK